MAEFDTVSKQLIKNYPADFVRFSLEQEDVEVLEMIDTEQPTVESRRTDSFIRVRIHGEEALVHNEFQTGDSTQTPMPRRMAGYIGRGIETTDSPSIPTSSTFVPTPGKPIQGSTSKTDSDTVSLSSTKS